MTITVVENGIRRPANAAELAQIEADAQAAESARIAAIQAQVNAERERRLIAGVTVNVSGYGDIPLQGRDQDQINLLALKDTARDLAAAGVTTAVIPFRDADNVTHTLTPAQMIELANEGKTAASAIYQASWAIKARNDLATIDITDDQYWSA